MKNFTVFYYKPNGLFLCSWNCEAESEFDASQQFYAHHEGRITYIRVNASANS